jgi:hypothetical protein
MLASPIKMHVSTTIQRMLRKVATITNFNAYLPIVYAYVCDCHPLDRACLFVCIYPDSSCIFSTYISNTSNVVDPIWPCKNWKTICSFVSFPSIDLGILPTSARGWRQSAGSARWRKGARPILGRLLPWSAVVAGGKGRGCYAWGRNQEEAGVYLPNSIHTDSSSSNINNRCIPYRPNHLKGPLNWALAVPKLLII